MLAGNYTDIDVCMCPANNYTGGRCQPGTYCPSGSSAPVLCIAGQYCEDYELPLPNGACASQRYLRSLREYRKKLAFACIQHTMFQCEAFQFQYSFI